MRSHGRWWMGSVFAVVVGLALPGPCRLLTAQVAGGASRPGVVEPSPRTQRIPEPPLPPGREFVAADGDRIVVPFDARVETITRYEGQVRVATDPTRMVLVVLVDAQTERRAPDGIVDWRFRFKLGQPFPVAETWEGPATIEDPRPSPGMRRGFSLRGAGLAIDVVSPMLNPPTDVADGVIRVVSHGGGAGREWASFDAAEAAAIADAPSRRPPPADPQAGRAPTAATGPSGAGSTASSLSTLVGTPTHGVVHSRLGSVPDGPGPPPLPPPPPPDDPASLRPVRALGYWTSPTKLVDARPAMPEAARQAGLRGVVILELTIDEAGNVAHARVLRSIPLLDDAALAAVKQWKYAPTLLNGVPVPIVATVTVTFPPAPPGGSR